MQTQSEVTDVIFYSFGHIVRFYNDGISTCMAFQMNRANDWRNTERGRKREKEIFVLRFFFFFEWVLFKKKYIEKTHKENNWEKYYFFKVCAQRTTERIRIDIWGFWLAMF